MTDTIFDRRNDADKSSDPTNEIIPNQMKMCLWILSSTFYTFVFNANFIWQ